MILVDHILRKQMRTVLMLKNVMILKMKLLKSPTHQMMYQHTVSVIILKMALLSGEKSNHIHEENKTMINRKTDE